MDRLYEKLQNKWLLVASLPIILLLGVWCYLSQKQPNCAKIPILENATDMKSYFCQKFDDIMSKEYFAMIQRSHQMEISFYRNVYTDLSTADKHSELLRDILHIYNDTIKLLHNVDNKENRLKVLEIWRDQGIRHTDLTQVTTKDYDTLDFHKILEKNNLLKYKYVMGAELFDTIKNIHKYWKHNVACEPTQYFRIYPEFLAIEELFEKINSSSNDKQTLHIISNLLSEMDQFFNENMKFFPYYREISKDILYNFFMLN